jgi:hypothetical protein
MFGECQFTMPELPVWANRQIAVEFRATSRDTEYCLVYSRKP